MPAVHLSPNPVNLAGFSLRERAVAIVQDETAYLLHSPANAQRLRSAVEQLASGQGVERALLPHQTRLARGG